MDVVERTTRLRFLVAVHSGLLCAVAVFVQVLRFPFIRTAEGYIGFELMVAGFFAAQVSLLAIWAAVSTVPAYVRITGLLVSLVMLSYIYPGVSDVNVACGWWWTPMYDAPPELDYSPPIERYMSWFVALSCLAATVAIPLSVFRSIKACLRQKISKWRLQFSLKTAMGWTSAFAILAGTWKWLAVQGWYRDGFFAILRYSANLAPVTYGIIAVFIAILFLQRVRWFVPFCAASILIYWVPCKRYGFDENFLFDVDSPPQVLFACIYLTYAVLLVVSLHWISTCGLHLHSRRFAAASDADASDGGG